MTIEINRAGSEYIYRQNPYQPREIDRRKNQHGARWTRFTIAATEEGARKILFSLQNDNEDDSE